MKMIAESGVPREIEESQEWRLHAAAVVGENQTEKKAHTKILRYEKHEN